MKFKEFFLTLNESVQGNLAWLYHRTNTYAYEHPISRGIFSTSDNKRALYGTGLYTTYDLNSQLNERMRHLYGPFILRFKTNLSNFFILDEDVFKRLYPNQNFYDYLKKYNVDLVYEKGNEENDLTPSLRFTSDTARKYAKKIKSLNIFDGIIFTGRSDGKIAIVWKPETLVLHSFSEDEGKTWQKMNSLVKMKEVHSLAETVWRSFLKRGDISSMNRLDNVGKLNVVKNVYRLVVNSVDDIHLQPHLEEKLKQFLELNYFSVDDWMEELLHQQKPEIPRMFIEVLAKKDMDALLYHYEETLNKRYLYHNIANQIESVLKPYIENGRLDSMYIEHLQRLTEKYKSASNMKNILQKSAYEGRFK